MFHAVNIDDVEMEKTGVPCAEVNDIGELAATPQLAAVDLVHQLPPRAGEKNGPKVVGLPISFDRKRPHSPRSAPKLGEHTEQILQELGYAEADIAKLKADRIV